MRLTGLFPLALALLVAAPLPAQRSRARDRDRGISDHLDTTVALSRRGTVELSLISGEIRVTSWNRDAVRINASVEDGRLNLDASGNRISLEVRAVDDELGDATYEVTVPAGTRLIARAVSGNIAATGAGEVELQTVSGDIDVTDVGDRAAIVTVSGGVNAARLGASAKVSAVSGDIVVSDIDSELEAKTVSGDLTLRNVTAPYVRAGSVSGDVIFTGRLVGNGRYEFNTHSGDIALAIPATDATVRVETFSGEVESDFPMVLGGGSNGTVQRGRGMTFTLGEGGGPRLDLHTFSGDIRIERSGSERGR